MQELYALNDKFEWKKMEPVFIYYKNLSFNQNKRFTLEFSDGDLLEGFFSLKKKKKQGLL